MKVATPPTRGLLESNPGWRSATTVDEALNLTTLWNRPSRAGSKAESRDRCDLPTHAADLRRTRADVSDRDSYVPRVSDFKRSMTDFKSSFWHAANSRKRRHELCG